LKSDIKHTNWSQYNKNHSYDDADVSAKKAFVLKHASSKKWNLIWDIGCNTGIFSQLCSKYSDYIVAVDGDHDAVEQLYLSEKGKDDSNILPLIMNLSNISPNQGWGGLERTAFDNRKKPDLVLCLALIHHIRISANIPTSLFLKWLRSLDARVVIEFVNRDDEMAVKLLTNKKERYDDYNLQTFISESQELFEISDRHQLKNGRREMFFLTKCFFSHLNNISKNVGSFRIYPEPHCSDDGIHVEYLHELFFGWNFNTNLKFYIFYFVTATAKIWHEKGRKSQRENESSQ
jgi:SAM-dependent methyltransferase